MIKLMRQGYPSPAQSALENPQQSETTIWSSFFSHLFSDETGDVDNQNQFKEHMERYLDLYSPNAGAEISRTFRYSSSKEEACLISRKRFTRHEKIEHCTGILVPLSDAEDELLGRDDQTDFSIIFSRRRGVNGLFMGPCRFVNHDCQPNAEVSGWVGELVSE